jgi:hypothetical protein
MQDNNQLSNISGTNKINQTIPVIQDNVPSQSVERNDKEINKQKEQILKEIKEVAEKEKRNLFSRSNLEADNKALGLLYTSLLNVREEFSEAVNKCIEANVSFNDKNNEFSKKMHIVSSLYKNNLKYLIAINYKMEQKHTVYSEFSAYKGENDYREIGDLLLAEFRCLEETEKTNDIQQKAASLENLEAKALDGTLYFVGARSTSSFLTLLMVMMAQSPTVWAAAAVILLMVLYQKHRRHVQHIANKPENIFQRELDSLKKDLET